MSADATADDRAFVVAPATPDDLEGVLDVFESVAAEGRWIATEVPFDRDALRKRMLVTIEDDARLMLVARAGGRVVGQLALMPGWPGVLDVGMCVAAEWRGRGVGSALMDSAIDWARTTDCHKLQLHVYPHNAAAIALYERHGFEREGLLRKQQRRKNGDLWDALAMGLLLR
jgi:ribosomal protein S18 acetylase RimI-like enzyme